MDLEAVAVADFNGDGKSDLLWRNDNGMFTQWQSNGDGFDVEGFGRCLRDNGIEWEIDRSRPGWIGRFRMNGRQKLAAVARRNGYILIDGEKVRQPVESLPGVDRLSVDEAVRDAERAAKLGIPAIAIGAGGDSGSTHTTDEWYSNDAGPDGIERALLITLAMAGVA